MTKEKGSINGKQLINKLLKQKWFLSFKILLTACVLIFFYLHAIRILWGNIEVEGRFFIFQCLGLFEFVASILLLFFLPEDLSNSNLQSDVQKRKLNLANISTLILPLLFGSAGVLFLTPDYVISSEKIDDNFSYAFFHIFLVILGLILGLIFRRYYRHDNGILSKTPQESDALKLREEIEEMKQDFETASAAFWERFPDITDDAVETKNVSQNSKSAVLFGENRTIADNVEHGHRPLRRTENAEAPVTHPRTYSRDERGQIGAQTSLTDEIRKYVGTAIEEGVSSIQVQLKALIDEQQKLREKGKEADRTIDHYKSVVQSLKDELTELKAQHPVILEDEYGEFSQPPSYRPSDDANAFDEDAAQRISKIQPPSSSKGLRKYLEKVFQARGSYKYLSVVEKDEFEIELLRHIKNLYSNWGVKGVRDIKIVRPDNSDSPEDRLIYQNQIQFETPASDRNGQIDLIRPGVWLNGSFLVHPRSG